MCAIWTRVSIVQALARRASPCFKAAGGHRALVPPTDFRDSGRSVRSPSPWPVTPESLPEALHARPARSAHVAVTLPEGAKDSEEEQEKHGDVHKATWALCFLLEMSSFTVRMAGAHADPMQC